MPAARNALASDEHEREPRDVEAEHDRATRARRAITRSRQRPMRARERRREHDADDERREHERIEELAAADGARGSPLAPPSSAA